MLNYNCFFIIRIKNNNRNKSDKKSNLMLKVYYKVFKRKLNYYYNLLRQLRYNCFYKK